MLQGRGQRCPAHMFPGRIRVYELAGRVFSTMMRPRHRQYSYRASSKSKGQRIKQLNNTLSCINVRLVGKCFVFPISNKVSTIQNSIVPGNHRVPDAGCSCVPGNNRIPDAGYIVVPGNNKVPTTWNSIVPGNNRIFYALSSGVPGNNRVSNAGSLGLPGRN